MRGGERKREKKEGNGLNKREKQEESRKKERK